MCISSRTCYRCVLLRTVAGGCYQICLYAASLPTICPIPPQTRLHLFGRPAVSRLGPIGHWGGEALLFPRVYLWMSSTLLLSHQCQGASKQWLLILSSLRFVEIFALTFPFMSSSIYRCAQSQWIIEREGDAALEHRNTTSLRSHRVPVPVRTSQVELDVSCVCPD